MRRLRSHTPNRVSSSLVRSCRAGGGHPIEPPEHVEVLLDRQVQRELGIRAGIPDHREDRFAIIGQQLAEVLNPARSRLQCTQEHLDRGRLPRSVGAEQPQDLGRLELERDVVNRRHRLPTPVHLRQLGHCQDGSRLRSNLHRPSCPRSVADPPRTDDSIQRVSTRFGLPRFGPSPGELGSIIPQTQFRFLVNSPMWIRLEATWSFEHSECDPYLGNVPRRSLFPPWTQTTDLEGAIECSKTSSQTSPACVILCAGFLLDASPPAQSTRGLGRGLPQGEQDRFTSTPSSRRSSEKGRELYRVRQDQVFTFRRLEDTVTMKMIYGTIETPEGEVLRLDTRTLTSDNEIRVYGDAIKGKMKLIMERDEAIARTGDHSLGQGDSRPLCRRAEHGAQAHGGR